MDPVDGEPEPVGEEPPICATPWSFAWTRLNPSGGQSKLLPGRIGRESRELDAVSAVQVPPTIVCAALLSKARPARSRQ